MLVNTVEDMPERLKDEFDYLSKKYPKIAFNHIDWNGQVRNDCEYLYAAEGFITIPRNYDSKIISQYKGLITHNRKFAIENTDLNIILTPGYLNFQNYYRLDSHKSFEERIDGVCSLHNIYDTGMADGDVVHRRREFIKLVPHDTKHTYGPIKWGDDYKGKIAGANHPNHINNLKVINKYKFSLALESTYHPMWSHDWITGRLPNAFKAKTIPLYYGCFNIEEHIPPEFYIDMRKYIDGPYNTKPALPISELKKEMDSYTKEKFEDQTERALEWYENESDLKNTPGLEEVFKSL